MIAITIFIIAIFIIRFIIEKKKYLLLSLAIQILCLKSSITLVKGSSFSLSDRLLGGFGTNMLFLITTIIPFLFLVLVKSDHINPRTKIRPKDYYLIAILFIISLVNIANPSKIATLVALVTFVQICFTFTFLVNRMTIEDIYKGVFDGLFVSICIQAFCTLLYPVLGVQTLNNIIASENALEWSQRRDTISAIGTFNHPGTLALFSVFAFSVFYSAYLNSFKKRNAIIGCCLSLFCIIFTFSRTSWVTSLLIFSIIYFTHKYGASMLKLRKQFILLSCLVVIVIVAIQVPYIYSMFFESDTSEQADNRFIHFALGYEIFKEHPILGVGINSHVQYMQTHSALYQIILTYTNMFTDFFTESPIHNFHIIILAETGIIGFALWIWYLLKTIVKCIRTSNSSLYYSLCSNSGVGILSAFFVYGMLGWSGCNYYIYYFPILVFLIVKKISNERSISM